MTKGEVEAQERCLKRGRRASVKGRCAMVRGGWGEREALKKGGGGSLR